MRYKVQLLRALSLLAPLLGGCASDFDFTPPDSHPAAASAPVMTPPLVADPDAYTPPSSTAPDHGHDGHPMRHDGSMPEANTDNEMPHDGEGGGGP